MDTKFTIHVVNGQIILPHTSISLHDISTSALITQYSPSTSCRLYFNGFPITSMHEGNSLAKDLSHCSDQTGVISFQPILLGGKGGFGANLRTSANKRKGPRDERFMRLNNGQRVQDVNNNRMLDQYARQIREEQRVRSGGAVSNSSVSIRVEKASSRPTTTTTTTSTTTTQTEQQSTQTPPLTFDAALKRANQLTATQPVVGIDTQTTEAKEHIQTLIKQKVMNLAHRPSVSEVSSVSSSRSFDDLGLNISSSESDDDQTSPQ